MKEVYLRALSQLVLTRISVRFAPSVEYFILYVSLTCVANV